MEPEEFEYVGFWARVAASIVDSILVLMISAPVLHLVYGRAYWTSSDIVQGPVDLIMSWVFPAIAVLVFWISRQATPGKMLISAKVVDAKTGGKPSTGQFVGRYLGYFVSTIPLFLGLLWVGIDGRKQGWHDKLAGTVVVRPKPRVTFATRDDSSA
ncbi:MAG: RDD family protein [Woeseia sp.]